VEYVPDHRSLPERMKSDLRSGDVVIFMGAGSIDNAGRELLALLGGRV
jgi:UDP-N-acetylmuramate-alanine ligase